MASNIPSMIGRFSFPLHFRVAGIAALLLLCRTLFSQAPASAISQPELEWKIYSSVSDGFSISFPGEPELSKQRIPSQSGTLELRTYLVTPGSATLYVAVCDYGATAQGHDPQILLAGAEKGAIDNVKAHLLADHKITLGDSQGLAFEAENDTVHFSARFYVAGTTLYEIIAASPLKGRFADTKRFMDSFQFIPRMEN